MSLSSWDHGMMITAAAKTGAPLKLLTRVGMTAACRSNNISSTRPGSPILTGKPSAKLRSQSVDETHATGSGKTINSARYKTELCRPFMETNTCKYGDKCQFAHGRLDLREMPRHPKYKTEYCRTYHTQGFCPYGPRCHFIHTNSGTASAEVGDSEGCAFSHTSNISSATGESSIPVIDSMSGSDSPASFSPSGGCTGSDDDAFYPAQTSSPKFGVFLDSSDLSEESFDSSQLLFFPGSVCSEPILSRQYSSIVDSMINGEFDASLQLSDGAADPDLSFSNLMRPPMCAQLTHAGYVGFDPIMYHQVPNGRERSQRLPIFTRLSSSS